ncbi:hypothetical protein [Qipengyuania sp. NPDC077563]|uniref:hypothetical protein n=1 Tax=Qipengyuania sp. NPDC077563 TaxID=3364497 RepID=UPI0038514054
MSIADQRHRFSIPDDVHYLNCAYMAPLSREVSGAMVEGARLKEQPWNFLPADFFRVAENFRESAGRLAGVSPDRIAIVPSVSYGLAVAAANLPLAAGQNVVTLGDQFPSNVYVWQERARAAGAEVIAVSRPSQSCWSGAVLDAIGRIPPSWRCRTITGRTGAWSIWWRWAKRRARMGPRWCST